MESDEIALNHYQSRLKASTFGAWNAWLSTEKIEIARNECEALTFSHNRCLEAVVNRFISNVYQANKRKYNLILGYTMHRLLLTRRCLQCLGRFVHRKRFTPSKLQRNLIANFTYNHSAKLRLYHRYRQKVIRRLHFRKEVYQALRDPTSCWCVLARSALQQWTCSTAKSIQDRTLLSKSAVLCKRAVKRRFLRKFCIASAVHFCSSGIVVRAETQFPSMHLVCSLLLLSSHVITHVICCCVHLRALAAEQLHVQGRPSLRTSL